MAALETPSGLWRSAIVDRERLSISVHRDALRGSELPPPSNAQPKTFLHGFLLPFSLIFATLRHPTLGLSYLRVFVVRMLVVGVLAAIAFCYPDVLGRPASGALQPKKAHGLQIGKPGRGISITIDGEPGKNGATPTPPASSSDAKDEAEEEELDEAARTEAAKQRLLKETNNNPIAAAAIKAAEAAEKAAHQEEAKAAAEPAFIRAIKERWTWVAWFLGIISAMEAVVVFFSRTWDDWLSFFASSVARIRPEDETPKSPRLSLDIPWSVKKLKRRVRGYVLFSAGLPILWLLQLIPAIGHVLFGLGVTVWGWYWLAVFTAAKSAHAWADDGVAPPPFLIRELQMRAAGPRYLRPVALYARVWARITRSVNAAAATFERNPAPFLGLALARVVLSLPGLYLLARPIVPVAAGRICAENDPQDRFST